MCDEEKDYDDLEEPISEVEKLAKFDESLQDINEG
ncbi:hypothetical protein [Vibrio phage Va2]|nr:hypothetical protein [Vibrio phage Va2]